MTTTTIARQIGIGVVGLSVLLATSVFTAQAAHINWDTTGEYDIAFDYMGGTYIHDLTLTQTAGGALDGMGGYPAGGPYTYEWDITSGTVSGDTIAFTANYTKGADAMTPPTTLTASGTIASDGSFSGTWMDNYMGGSRHGSFHTTAGAADNMMMASLAAEDFGVMDQSGVKGYTAGFGLTDATLANIDSVVVRLYSGATLLQTNTGTDKISMLSGTQFSSPFDVYGTFNYMTDGYWTNVRSAEYGKNLVPTRVVATVTLNDGTVLTAENTNLTGDPASIKPVTTPTTPSMKDQCKNGGYKHFTNPTYKNQGQCVSAMNHLNKTHK